MKIIAFGHRQEVGKDTACQFLVRHLRMHRNNLDIVRKGFADKIKEIAFDLYKHKGLKKASFYDLPENRHLKNEILPLIGKSPRQIYIMLGNSCRGIYDNTWLDYVFENSNSNLLIITDLRFPNEAEEILKRNGKLYKIDRLDRPKVADGADDPLENFDKWTGVILNDGSLATFYERVIETCGGILS